MAVVRVCFVFVLIVCFSCTAGKPIFTRMIMCGLFCDDDDFTSTSTTTSSSEEYYDWFDCRTDCRRPTTPRPGNPPNPPMGPGAPGAVNPSTQMPINFMFAGGQPMNVTMQNQGNNWMMYVVPGSGSATPSPMAGAAPAPAPAPAGGRPGDAAAAPSETATTVVSSPTTVTTPSA